MSLANLLDYNHQALHQWLKEIGEAPYRATQILKWLHAHGETDFNQMTNLSKSLREKLQASFEIQLPEVVYRHLSKDGTRKWVLRYADQNSIETVFIPETKRGTLCVSSQVGCALNCDFCSTGKQGFNRNLSTGEILAQLWLAVTELREQAPEARVTNVVFMGMGEPLLNYEAVLPAIGVMLHDECYGLAKRRVTVSTSGIVPRILQLSEESDAALAISLHAPTDQVRDQIVPLNKKYPLSELMAACETYLSRDARRKITFEYVMLAGVNDSLTHAKQLIRLLSKILPRSKMNLIPFNPFPHTSYQRSSPEVIEAFMRRCQGAGLITTVRKTRGDDIDGACGQLVGQLEDKSRRSEVWQAKVAKRIPIVSVQTNQVREAHGTIY